MLKGIWREFYEYLTYDDYGRRRPRPAVYGLLAAVAVILGMMLAAGIFALQAPPAAPQPVPTFAPPTATAIVARIATATASAPPTPTPAPLCPDDPRLWQLVEMRPFLDPKTGQPIQMLKPYYRIEPLCVYERFWADAARILALNDPPAPSVEKWVENVPWYWKPGPDIVYREFRPLKMDRDFLFYDRDGRRIDEVLTAVTAVWTGDPDYPVLVYVYRDSSGAAYRMQWREGRIAHVGPVALPSKEKSVVRRVFAFLYDMRSKHWVLGDTRYRYERAIHAVPEDGSWMWEIYGVCGFRRSELIERFGLKDFSPERINFEEWKLEETMNIED
ncbi:hypothetical protein [Thermoflexus sp.]|uniref:hypothetical protein n=1 Tax=Thermoflexus sp. TaxID=1969742 RepID=UPI002ADD83E4|nr:hypothetical protein [Thermoflexus sp.]